MNDHHWYNGMYPKATSRTACTGALDLCTASLKSQANPSLETEEPFAYGTPSFPLTAVRWILYVQTTQQTTQTSYDGGPEDPGEVVADLKALRKRRYEEFLGVGAGIKDNFSSLKLPTERRAGKP